MFSKRKGNSRVERNNNQLKYDYSQMKEPYDKMSSKTKQFIDVSRKDPDTKQLLEATLEAKQNAINMYIDTISLLKLELATIKIETERVNKKLISYLTSSYLLD
ncbi:hypothetical protein Hanom_Chr08g00723531 [Helianthus anomalus]